MIRKLLSIVASTILMPALASQGAVVWSLSTFDATGAAPKTVFMVGESGFVDVSVTLSDTLGIGGRNDLTDLAASYQAIVSLTGGPGITLSPAVDFGAGAPDDIHLAPVLGSLSPTQFVGGEFAFAPIVPPSATTTLFRLPFVVDPAAAGGAFTFSVVENSPSTFSETSWNGNVASDDLPGSFMGGSAGITVTAVPEPSSLAVCGLMLAGVVARRRQRAKRARALVE